MVILKINKKEKRNNVNCSSNYNNSIINISRRNV